ncbi:hypothetical protein KY342_06060 [Candidatus Woesearchaeota archaeon]|nr:hypothetical protein [Candidatus Woesearchaeota archaeon]
MTHTREIQEDVTYSAENSLDQALGKRLDFYGDYDTGGPEQDDFLPITEEIMPVNIWSNFDLIKKLTYGFTASEEETINPFEDYDLTEEHEEPEYNADDESLNEVYTGPDFEEEILEMLQNKYQSKLNDDDEDILSELQKRIEEELELDYEESELEQPPEGFIIVERKKEIEEIDEQKQEIIISLEQEIRKA